MVNMVQNGSKLVKNGPKGSNMVHYGLNLSKKSSKWVRHNQVSWSSFSVVLDATHGRFQMTSISNGELIITNVYRSGDAGKVIFFRKIEKFY